MKIFISLNILFFNSITQNTGFVQLKTQGIIKNNRDFYSILKPGQSLTMLKGSNKNNTQLRNMFNDHIYNRVNTTNINSQKIIKKKESKKVKKYSSDEEKFFASRHIFGLSDYDFTILRIYTYIVITSYCVVNLLFDIKNMVN